MGKGIFCLLDYFSVMCDGYSIRDAIEWLGLDYDSVVSDFTENIDWLNDGQSFGNWSYWRYNNIKIMVRDVLEYGQHPDDAESFFEVKQKSVKIDISGQGLDYLRFCGLDPDQRLRDPSRYVSGIHRVKRADFAFDLIDYAGDFYDQCKDWCNSKDNFGRLLMMRMGPPMVFSLKSGKDRTLYLGSTQGPKLLRIYDKKFQLCDPVSGCWKQQVPYPECESWIRLEWQMRDDSAARYLLGDGDYLSIFRDLYDFYKFADPDTPAHRRQPAQFWVALFDWQSIPSLIQNFYFPSYQPSNIEDVPKRVFSQVALYIGKFGLHQFLNALCALLRQLSHPESYPAEDRTRAYRRLRSFAYKMDEQGIVVDQSAILSDKKGGLIFNFDTDELFKTMDQWCKDLYK